MGSQKWRLMSGILAAVLLVALFTIRKFRKEGKGKMRTNTRKFRLVLTSLVLAALLLSFSLVPAAQNTNTFTFPGGSLTTTNTGSWGGYNIHSYGAHFNVDAGLLTIEYLGVNAYPINYTGDFGWPPDSTDTGASVIVGVGNGINIAQYSFKSNMSGNKPRGTDPETYGKGSWDYQNIGHWNDDGYRSYLFQGQFTDHWAATVGNSQYNAEKHGGPTGTDPDYDTFDFKFYVEQVASNTYEVTGWHNLWKSSAIDEGCGWDWNYAKNAHTPAKRGYLKCFEGTWTADGGLDLSDVKVFLAIQNWQGTQPELHTFDWDSVKVTGTVIPPDEVWVDDNWTGYSNGDPADGHTFGYDAFATIQDGIDAVAGSTVNVAAGTYDEYLVIQKSIHLIGEDKNTTILTYTGTPAVEQLIMLGWNKGGTLAGGATVQGFKLIADGGLYGDKDLIKLRANGASGAPIVIKDNIFKGDGVTRYLGIETAYDAGYVKVENNEFYDLAYGAWFNVLINGEIKGNTITDTIWSALAINTSDLDRTHDIDILDNTILRTGVGTGSPTWSAGLHLGSTIYSVLVAENTIADGYDHGVYVMHRDTVVMTDVHINNNNIYNNVLGSVNELKTAGVGVVVDATNNWWGAPTGPYHPTSWTYDSQVITNPDGEGDEVSDYVLYEPWYRPITPMASFVVDHAKIDFKKKADDDKVRVKGKLDPASDVDIDDDVTVTVGPLSETITMEEKGKEGEKWEYKRPKGGTGDIKHMTINWKNGKFDIRMDKADLSDLTDPNNVTISVQIGDDIGSESITMKEHKHHWDYKANKPKAVELEPVAITGPLKVVAYPNPIRDVHTATFQAKGTLAAQVEEIRVQIYDLSGRLVWEDAAPGSELDWHTDCLSGDYLANGMYLYRVQLRIDGNWISQDIGKIAVLR